MLEPPVGDPLPMRGGHPALNPSEGRNGAKAPEGFWNRSGSSMALPPGTLSEPWSTLDPSGDWGTWASGETVSLWRTRSPASGACSTPPFLGGALLEPSW